MFYSHINFIVLYRQKVSLVEKLRLITFCVVAFSPVVSCSRLSKYKVIWSEYLSVRSRSDWVHSSGFQIHKNSTGDIFTTWGFIIINIDSFQLEITVSMVSSSRVDTVLVGNDFPELKIIKEREKLKIKSFSREIKTKDWGESRESTTRQNCKH